MFPEFAQAAVTLGGQVLPASFEVRLQAGAGGAPVEPLVDALRRLPGVSDVRYDREWVARLQGIVRAVRAVGAALVLVLVLAAALTVASVVRLALHARRQEIEIMHLVGAPLTYIRGPFVMEGVVQGGLGAVVALALLVALYVTARVRLDDAAAAVPGLGAAAPAFLPAAWIAALVAGGMAVGCIGGLVAARSTRAADTDR
jgi:cell division transport system permease protein